MDIADRIIGCTLWLLGAVVVGLILWLGFAVTESATGSSVTLTGPVVSKRHVPAYTTTTLIPCGKVMIPQTQHHPARWAVTVRTEARGDIEADVTRERFDRLAEAEVVTVSATSGRWSGTLYDATAN